MKEKGRSSTEPCLQLRFLGGCEILLPEGPARLETAKTRALLVYLALNPGPIERHRLMGLLWGDSLETKARRNLRRALWNLRRQLTSSDLPCPIVADRDVVAFDRKAAYSLDVEAFETACNGRVRASQKPAPSLELESLRLAAELYKGDLLEGFFVGDAPAFEEWVLVERERLRTLALLALEQLVKGYSTQGESETALIYARNLLAIEPWREETHRQLMRLLALAGQRTSALAQYETCRRILAEELGIEPAGETTALYDHIKAGLHDLSPSNLPAQSTRFVGREKELAEIDRLLDEPGCRLLTLTGPGGVGKTRLALQAVAHNADEFAHGVFFVPLAKVRSPQNIIPALMNALRVTLFGSQDPKSQLLDYLREKQMLLLLDNFEHLFTEMALLTEILSSAPGVKIIVTSRERLHLQGEWAFTLRGLDFPSDEHFDQVDEFDAGRLFLQAARRAHLGFTLAQGERNYLARICRLVSGLPLALELTAAWVRVLRLEEIAQEIEHNLDLLAVPRRNLSERHNSIRLVFEHSWNLLSEIEKRALQKLSVFRGGFHREAAELVAGASLPTLAALVDKSLLRRRNSARYEMHELLRQYAQEKLGQNPREYGKAHHLHCEAFATSLHKLERSLKDGKLASTVGELGEVVESVHAELDDIRAAWHWAIAVKDLGAIEKMCEGISTHCHITTTFREGETFFREALEGLGWLKNDQIHVDLDNLLCWKLLVYQAGFAIYLGQYDQARVSLERCYAFSRHHPSHQVTASILFFLGEIARFSGDYRKAQDFLQKGLTIFREVGEPGGAGLCLNVLGLVSAALKEYVEARDFLDASLGIFKEASNPWGQAIATINLAALLKGMGDYPAASGLLNDGFMLCQEMKHRWGMATCRIHSGDIARIQRIFDEAKAFYQDGLSILKEIGYRQGIARALNNLGNVACEQGELQAAYRHFREALKISIQIRAISMQLEILVDWADALHKEGTGEVAVQLLALAHQHAASEKQTQERAEQLLSELQSELPRESYSTARERGIARKLDEVVEELMTMTASA